jgi:hypothetical protein
LTIFSIFHGNSNEVSIKSLSDKLQVQESQLTAFYNENILKVLRCLLDFAETYSKRNYFYNYI